MAIELVKGQKLDLHKDHPTLKVGHCGLGWDLNTGRGAAFDLDFFMIECGEDGKAINEKSLIFYNNKKSMNGSVYVGEDNLTGAGDGYDEEGFIKFAEVPANVKSIITAVSIYEYDVRRQNFGQVNNAICDILNGDTNEKLIHYDLTEDMSNATGVIVGRFMRESNGNWSFKAVGEALDTGMFGIMKKYGLAA